MNFDLYPALAQFFEDNPTAIDCAIRKGERADGPIERVVTRAEFEREKLTRDLFRLTKPVGRIS